MKPNFNDINIKEVAASKATVNGENWLTPEQIQSISFSSRTNS